MLVNAPFFCLGQQKGPPPSIQEISWLYESLPKENGKVRWHESINVDSTLSAAQLAEKAKSALLRILPKNREEEFTEDNNGFRLSAIGTYFVKGGSKNNYFYHVEGAAEVDVSINIEFHNGSCSVTLSDVAVFIEEGFLSVQFGSKREFTQASLEDVYALSVKSNAKKIERRIFQQTVTQLQEKLDLLKILMKHKG